MHDKLELGTIIEMTMDFDSETITKRMLVIEDPRTSTWKDCGVWVRLLYRKTGELEAAWQVQLGQWRLDCLREPHLISNEQLKKLRFTIVDQLTDDEMDEVFDAEGYAEKQRYFDM